jgi:hypothetical protein
MAVNVREDGCIIVDDCMMADCIRFKNAEKEATLFKVAFQVVFENEEDSRRFYNALNASVAVGCVHVHFEDMKVEVVSQGRAN